MLRNRHQRVGALLLALVSSTILMPHAPAAAAPGSCTNPSEPGQIISDTPWHQQWLAPRRVWPFSTGAGVSVAVVDSGSDGNHPQLDGQVTSGFDALRGSSGGDFDCVSHGTAVASLIAARPQEGIGFHGMAPEAAIVPIRVSEQAGNEGDEAQGESVSPEVFAQAIRRATDDGADVINMSVTLYRPDSAVESAIRYARAKDVVLVAAAGNLHRNGEYPDPVPYPAAYDGVIGVGAIDEQGTRVEQSQVGPYVDLVAPGGAVVAATRVNGHDVWSGTSFATPLVSATAALIRAAEPQLSASQVSRRLLATADPARGGPEQGYGQGVLSPYRAVTERLSSAGPVAADPLPEPSYNAAAQERTKRWNDFRRAGLWGGLSLAAIALVVGAIVSLLPRGRRLRWHPTRPGEPTPSGPEIDEPEEVFFRVPSSLPRD
ncbi:type VII secretion-associated serine protease mycosin [Salinispora oceanensis]|uniref:type VII secretion-associated serine protease mycosin n=1 Tax=Salinispora oceanensis TaxID=1050199 RepID=UPI000535490E|nr:type VII secretion-associated serine protease mycosin [Salinispora oceanensis]